MLELLKKIGLDATGYNGLVMDASLPSWPWIALFVATAAAMVWLNFKGTSPLDLKRRRTILFVLRALAVLSLAAVLLNPAMVLEQREPIRPRIVVLWDTSRSMNLKSKEGGSTRIDEMKAFWDRADKLREKLKAEYAVEVMGFDSGVKPLSGDVFEKGPELAPTGEETDILGALKAAAKSETGAPLAGVLLLSDGGDNAGLSEVANKPEELESIFKDYPAPVFPVAPEGGDMKDIAISDLSAPDYAFVRNAVDIKLTLRARKFGPTEVPVTLYEGDRVLTTQTVTVGTGQETYPVTLSVSPERVGTFIYTVKVPAFEGESVLENNERRFSLQSLRDKIRVLHVVGSPSWDQRFLREALTKDPTIELVSFYILREINDATFATNDELSLIPFPVDELFDSKMRTFDLIIFQNFAWRTYMIPSYLDNITRFVRDFGGGFMMIGGPRSFESGGYGMTTFMDILPVEMGVSGRPFEEGEYKPRLTDAGARHPITALRPGAEESKLLWESMPPVEGFNPTVGLKPEATALLEHPFNAVNGQNLPVMAVSQAGRGRVLALTTDTSWRWNYLRSEGGGGASDYLRMWRSAVRWLVGDPEGKQVRVRTDKVKYGSSDPVRIRVRVLGRDYAPAPEPKITLKLIGEKETKDLVDLKPEGEEWGIDIENPGEGGWRVEASADNNVGEFLASDEAAFVVEGNGVEYEKPWPNPELLANIARVTGGKSWKADSSADIGAIPTPKAWRVAGRKRMPLWDNWLMGGLMLLLLAGEWYLRRRWGLN